MLTQICQYLRNWFKRDSYIGTFTITSGVLSWSGGTLPLVNGQYYRIIGSLLNDGVHHFGDVKDTLSDETFDGAVWSMAIPPDFLDLAGEISGWCDANADALNSPYSAESFGGYSYSLRSGANGEGATWQSQFAARLSPWRKI